MSQNSSLCKSQLNFIENSLKIKENLFDFATRLPAEIFYQNTRRYEIFAECLHFVYKTQHSGTIHGQYCAVSGESLYGGPKLPHSEWQSRNFDAEKYKRKIRFESGLCLPKACGSEEVELFVGSVLDDVNLVAKRIFCNRNDSLALSVMDFLILFTITALVLVVAISTFYELKSSNRHTQKRQTPLAAFSLYTNAKELLRVDKSHPQKSIECINGLRSVAAIWVIMSHRLSRATDNPNMFLKQPLSDTNLIFEIIWHTSIPVDVFVFISAVLATLSCLKMLEKRKFNYVKFIVHRYMRYAPSVVFLMIFMISFIPYSLVGGPSINVMNEQVRRCQTYWWSTVLMVQNYANTGGSCIPPSWYLCVDYQLYVLSPVLVYLVWKLGLRSFWVFGTLMLTTQSYQLYMRYNDLVTNHEVYTKTHFRIGQWTTGVIFGYLMHRIEYSSPKFEISKRFRRLIWSLIPLGLLLSQNSYSTFVHILPDAFYQAIQDIMFMCFLGWTLITFHFYKSGNIFRWFLSHPYWQPFAKLTLSTFLVHDIFIFMTIASTKSLAPYGFAWMMLICLRDLAASTILGAVLFLFVEVPAAKVASYFLYRKWKDVQDGDGDATVDTPLHRC